MKILKDNFNRKIEYLRISITDRCNSRCKYCMPADGVEFKPHIDILSFEEIIIIVKVFAKLGVKKIRLTGGEPLVRKNVVSLVKNISAIEGIEEVVMTTNGLLLKKYAKELKEAGLNRVNISIDSLNEEKYSQITRGSNLNDVLEGIEEAKKVGLTPIKLNTVLVNGFNDDEIIDLVELTKDEKIDVRFIELMTIGETSNWTRDRYISNDIVLEKVEGLKKVRKKDKSAPADYYQIPGYLGRVGLINPISCSFCSNCNRVRLTSTGRLKLCLHSDVEYNLKKYLDSEEILENKLLEIIKEKPEEHKLNKGISISKSMFQIGG
ncbi:MAG: GTP 3',8-cyclase MoaA [Bacillota bacterium]|nr:GTP 3',8-cyclase MoaA [Bacillota bacterium]